MEFEWVNVENVDDAMINCFNSGNHVFDDFLYNKAKKWNGAGEAITYVFADKSEIVQNDVKRIYGFITINTIGLLFNTGKKNEYLSCAEIRLFAIAEQLRKNHNPTIDWSNRIFKVALQNLYQMSTSIIGFKGIFLNANHDGYKLYVDNGFNEITDYVTPEVDEKLELIGCKPLLLLITDNVLYDIFDE